MVFVYTFWYFVMIALVAGIVASIIVLVKMNKKDDALMNKFVAESSKGSVEETKAEEKPVEETKEETK